MRNKRVLATTAAVALLAASDAPRPSIARPLPQAACRRRSITSRRRSRSTARTSSRTCESCHVDGQFAGTPLQCAGCHSQGSRVRATFKPARHDLTTEYCEACHLPAAWVPRCASITPRRSAPAAAATTTTAQAANRRTTCPPASNATTAIARARGRRRCSSTRASRAAAWFATTARRQRASPRPHSGRQHLRGLPPHDDVLARLRVDHLQVIGVCSSCHNGTIARGQHAAHIPTVNECDSCHNTTALEP